MIYLIPIQFSTQDIYVRFDMFMNVFHDKLLFY